MEIQRRSFLGGMIASLFGSEVVREIIAKAPKGGLIKAFNQSVKGSLCSTTPAVQNLLKPGLHWVPIDKLKLNPMALRAVDKTSPAFMALVDSIKENGVMAGLTIRDDGTIVDGAHRLEAAKVAGLTEVPANVMVFDTINNLQNEMLRANLVCNQAPIEDEDDEFYYD